MKLNIAVAHKTLEAGTVPKSLLQELFLISSAKHTALHLRDITQPPVTISAI